MNNSKKEILIAVIYVILLTLTFNKVTYFNIISIFSLIPILIFFITNIKYNKYWINDKKILAMFSILFKMNIYITILFTVLNYPGFIFLYFYSLFLAILYLILAIFNKDNKEAIIAMTYINIGSFLVFVL